MYEIEHTHSSKIKFLLTHLERTWMISKIALGKKLSLHLCILRLNYHNDGLDDNSVELLHACKDVQCNYVGKIILT